MVQGILVAFADNLLGEVVLLLGLVTMTGLLLQRRSASDVIGGTVRAAIGVAAMIIGMEVFVAGLGDVQLIVSSAFGLEAAPSASTLDGFLEGAGSVSPLVMAGGFAVHLLLVRVFRAARFVYLTGHLMFWLSVVVTASFMEIMGERVDEAALVGCGSIVLGCYLTLQPVWTEPLMRKVVGRDTYGLAHTTSTLILATGYGARLLRLGDPVRHDTERLKVPPTVAFLKDMNVATALVISAILLATLPFARPEAVAEVVGPMAPLSWGIVEALRFAAGLAILLFGVRMFLAEIVPSFKGISDRLLPGSIPALDIPVVFPRAPIAVLVGFLASLATFLALMALFAVDQWFVLVPPMIMLFFGGGAAGVFGNAVAGWRGAVFGGILNGLILAFGQWCFWGLWSGTAPELATLSDADWYALGGVLMALGSLARPLGPAGIWVTTGIVLATSLAALAVLSRRAAHASLRPSGDQPPEPAPSGPVVPDVGGAP